MEQFAKLTVIDFDAIVSNRMGAAIQTVPISRLVSSIDDCQELNQAFQCFSWWEHLWVLLNRQRDVPTDCSFSWRDCNASV